jgi:hypothetical protein
VVDRLEDVGATRTSLDRFDRVEREPLPEDVLDLPFERLAAKSGALLLGRLLQLLDLPLHLLEGDVLLVQLELVLLGESLPRLRDDLLALGVELARKLKIQRLPLFIELAPVLTETKLALLRLLRRASRSSATAFKSAISAATRSPARSLAASSRCARSSSNAPRNSCSRSARAAAWARSRSFSSAASRDSSCAWISWSMTSVRGISALQLGHLMKPAIPQHRPSVYSKGE